MTVQRKLYGGFGATVALLLILGVIAYSSLASVTASTADVSTSATMDDAAMSMIIALLEGMDTESMALIAGYDAELGTAFEESVVAFDDALATLMTEGNESVQAAATVADGYHTEFQAAVLRTFELAQAGDIDAARVNSFSSTDSAIGSAFDALDGVETAVEAFGDDALSSAESTSSTSETLVIAISVIAVLAAAAIAFFIARGIVGPLTEARDALTTLATGDLSAKVESSSSDEVGEMIEAYGHLQQYMNEMAGAAGDIARGDLSTHVTPKSADDTLGNAFVGMQGYLKGMAVTADRIADGDLTVNVTTQSEQDALANAFKTMVANLRTVIGKTQSAANSLNIAKDQLADIAEQSSTATQEVAQTIGQVAEGSSEQAQRVQDVNAAVERLNSSAEELDRQAREEVATAATRVATGAAEASEESKGASERAERGAQMVRLSRASSASRPRSTLPPRRSPSSVSAHRRSARSSRSSKTSPHRPTSSRSMPPSRLHEPVSKVVASRSSLTRSGNSPSASPAPPRKLPL